MATGRNLLVTLLMSALSALFGTISISTYGYQAFTKEELAATVVVTPISKQKFNAQFIMPDGTRKNFELAGDQLYIDAHILKWKPNCKCIRASYFL